MFILSPPSNGHPIHYTIIQSKKYKKLNVTYFKIKFFVYTILQSTKFLIVIHYLLFQSFTFKFTQNFQMCTSKLLLIQGTTLKKYIFSTVPPY